jgi:hypothetical protein
MRKYDFRVGARISGVEADVAGNFLEKLRKQNDGVVTPPIVVKAAKPKDSPVHDYFQWNDSIAANEHRLWQARHLLNCIMVKIEECPDKGPVRAFVRIKSQDEDGAKSSTYVGIRDVMRDPEMRQCLLEEARTYFLIGRRTYQELKELVAIFEAIDKVLV